MDLVDAGRERRPLHPALLAVAALAVAGLATAGTLRAMDTSDRRPVAAPSPVETSTSSEAVSSETVSSGSAVTAPPVAPGEGLDLLLVGAKAVTSLRTTDGSEDTVTTFPDTPVEKFVPLRHGFAALAGDVLVVLHPEIEARIRVRHGALVEGGTDTEFWILGAGTARRYDDRGDPAGPEVRLPEEMSVVRGVAGGRLLAYPDEHSTELLVWDPATRRVVRELGEVGDVLASAPRHVLTGSRCEGDCPFRVTNVSNGVTTTTALPDSEGEAAAVALRDVEAFAFVWRTGAESHLYLGTGGGAAPRLLTRGLPRDVRIQWVGKNRLAVLQLTDGRLVVSVVDTLSGELRQAGAYAAREVGEFVARPAAT